VYLDSTGTPVGAASAGFAVAMAIALWCKLWNVKNV
jgi:hypothetical protein